MRYINLLTYLPPLLKLGEQGLWRIEYLNTGRAETAICKQIGGGHDFTYRLFVR